MIQQRRRVLLIGWDAADWKVINPLMDAGKMPNLQGLVERGVMGNIATLHPMISPMLWTSVATGKRPYKHGIYGFTEPTDDALRIRPVSSSSRTTKALWNIFDQEGLKSNVIGWWPSYPAEPINGVMISDQYHKIHDKGLAPGNWQMDPANISVPTMVEEYKQLRVHPSDLTSEDVTFFVPEASRIDQKKDSRLFSVMKIASEATTIHNAATHAMETSEWDFMAVYYDAIDHFSHGFMRYHPPRLPHVMEDDFEIYSNVISAGYIYHDMMLGRLIELAGAETTVMLVSDHGFHSDHLRPKIVPNEPAGPTIEHREFGVFVMAGPGTKKDALVHGASLLDVAPTVLRLFDLPIGEDMDGRVISEGFEDPGECKLVESWDGIGPDIKDILPAKADELSHEDSEKALQQLVDLGYLEEQDKDLNVAVTRVRSDLLFNKARSLVDGARTNEALPIFVTLYNENPGEYRFGMHLANVLRQLGRIDDLELLIKQLHAKRKQDATDATEKLLKYEIVRSQRVKAKQENAEAKGSRDGIGNAADERIFSEDEIREIRDLRSRKSLNLYVFDFFQGYIHIAKKEYEQGIKCLEKSIESGGPRVSVYALLGDAYLGCRDADRALEAFQKGLDLDPLNPTLLLGKTIGAFRKRQNQETIELATQIIRLRYHFPRAHYFVGAAAHRQGDLNRAISSIQTAVQQNPNYRKAHSRLAAIFRQQGKLEQVIHHQQLALLAGDAQATFLKAKESERVKEINIKPDKDLVIIPETAEDETTPGYLPNLKFAAQNSRASNPAPATPSEVITVVSGLPRSGTSMMMQMLSAGGLPVFCDSLRGPDEDNPKGYFEHEAIKTLSRSNAFMAEAKGKVVKVVAQLIPYLPASLNYRVVFLDRDIDEIVLSQKRMLSRQESTNLDLDDKKMKTFLSRAKTDAITVLKDSGIPFMRVIYNVVAENPGQTIERIRQFVGPDIDGEKMALAVNPDLYRNRIANSSRA